MIFPRWVCWVDMTTNIILQNARRLLKFLADGPSFDRVMKNVRAGCSRWFSELAVHRTILISIYWYIVWGQVYCEACVVPIHDLRRFSHTFALQCRPYVMLKRVLTTQLDPDLLTHNPHFSLQGESCSCSSWKVFMWIDSGRISLKSRGITAWWFYRYPCWWSIYNCCNMCWETSRSQCWHEYNVSYTGDNDMRIRITP